MTNLSGGARSEGVTAAASSLSGLQPVVVFGASGYSGLELLRLLMRHDAVSVRAASSDRWAGVPVTERIPAWPSELNFERHAVVLEQVRAGDIAILATPAATSAELAPALLDRGLRVIDVSGAFRLQDPADYAEWYGFEHPAPELLEHASYGLPEVFSFAPDTRLVANPGCYATAAILAAAPLLHHHLLVPDAPLVLDGKSGVTGAGRALKDELLFSEVDESLRPYRVGRHQHTPEIEQALEYVSGRPVRVSFNAHLVPMRRGLLVSAYATVKRGVSQSDVERAYREALVDRPFANWVDRPPETGRVVHDSFAEVWARLDPRTGLVSAFCAIDNLLKGAAGQAVQNLNALLGLPEATGLTPEGR